MKEIIVNYYRGFLNLSLLFAKRLLFRQLSPSKFSHITKILVFRNGSIGDSICAMPALSIIKDNFIDAEIDLLTNSGGNEFVSMEQIIDRDFFNRIINYFELKWISLYRLLKANKYDLFIELPQSKSGAIVQLRNQVFASLLRIPYGLGWSVSRTLIFAKWQEKHASFLNERDRLLKILDSNDLKINNPQFLLGIDDHVSNEVFAEFKKLNLLDKRKNIGFVIGANRKRNRWPIENFVEVAAHYIEREFNILIFGGPEDELLASYFKQEDSNLFLFCNKFTVLETAEAMKNCSVVISNDTGPMHLAYSVGTPVVALFSSRNFPGEWDPPDNGSNKMVRTDNIDCSICFNNECNVNICMRMITPKLVVSLCDNVLRRELGN